MLWLVTALVPAVLVIGKAAYDLATGNDTPPRRARSTLERNLERLARELSAAHGRRVAVLGQPGAGKSSMLRRLSGNEVVRLPAVGVHTDATDWSERGDVELLCRWRGFVFADVPGYDTARHPVHTMLDGLPFDSFDVFVLVLRGKVRDADRRLYARLQQSRRPVVVVRNVAENLDVTERATVQADLKCQLGCGFGGQITFASNRTGEGLAEVLQRIG